MYTGPSSVAAASAVVWLVVTRGRKPRIVVYCGGVNLPPIAPDELERLRAETPGCAHRIHLNNAGAALMPAPVLAAMVGHLELEAEIGGYEAADARAGAA